MPLSLMQLTCGVFQIQLESMEVFPVVLYCFGFFLDQVLCRLGFLPQEGIGILIPFFMQNLSLVLYMLVSEAIR